MSLDETAFTLVVQESPLCIYQRVSATAGLKQVRCLTLLFSLSPAWQNPCVTVL